MGRAHLGLLQPGYGLLPTKSLPLGGDKLVRKMEKHRLCLIELATPKVECVTRYTER
jgi:hypothetical protein